MPGLLANTNPPVIYTANDDALSAFRVLSSQNHILLFTPTSPQTHEFHYLPLITALTQRYGKNVLAMDYTPPTNANKYLPFDKRHELALENPNCGGVIVVVHEDGQRTRGCQMDFARKVWDVVCKADEVPGVLVEIGGNRRGIGEWGSVVYAAGLGRGVLEGVADLMFTGTVWGD